IYDLNFFMVERADGWRASCEYNTDLYDAETIKRMLVQFQALLEGIAANPARRISEIIMLTEFDRRLLMPAASGPSHPFKQEANHSAVGKPTYVAPNDETEARLLTLWEQVIGVKPLGTTTDFFDAGGHSLLAAKLLAQ